MLRLGPLKIKIQLFSGTETALGPGKADLLDAIDRHGSIAGAGRAMGMSYRRTWLLVDTMNRCWSEPLVHAVAGGGAQKGARLTAEGQRVLEAYRRLEADVATAAERSAARESLYADLLDSPHPAQSDCPPKASTISKGRTP